jgi:hypothetical protein
MIAALFPNGDDVLASYKIACNIIRRRIWARSMSA